jgi:hypothetical protein
MEIGRLYHQDIDRLLSMATVVTEIGAAAIDWAEEYLANAPQADLDLFRRIAYDNACEWVANEDCLLDHADCEPEDFEAEFLIGEYVYAALAYAQQHTVMAKN